MPTSNGKTRVSSIALRQSWPPLFANNRLPGVANRAHDKRDPVVEVVQHVERDHTQGGDHAAPLSEEQIKLAIDDYNQQHHCVDPKHDGSTRQEGEGKKDGEKQVNDVDQTRCNV